MSPPTPAARVTLRDGRYALAGTLGEGAQGTTFEAVDQREGRLVAIKRFDVRGARAWKDVELAEREAKVLSSLSHPLLPRYLEHFEEGSVLYLVMEKIEGENVRALVKRGALAEADVVALLRDAASILDHLHGKAPPIIHRDLKPGNIIRRPDGRFCFVDFGAVRDKLRPEGGSTIVGTFGYMAPEQFQGRALPATDVYALGATALHMLTGEEPENLPHKGLGIDVAAALGRRGSREMISVLSAMLDPDPDRRPARLEPLLSRLGAPTSSKHDTKHDTRGQRDKRDKRDRSAERAREAEERVARRRHRQEQWSRRPRHGRAPFFIRVLVPLVLFAVQLVLTLTLRVAVPMVLTILSLFFGRGLLRAASRVGGAGDRAVAAVGRAREVVAGRVHEEADEPKIRVVQADEPRVRVEGTSETEIEDLEAEEPAERARRRAK